MFIKLKTINSEDGLPNEQIHAIDQDKNGRLWLASPAGLACYNGNKVNVYDTRSGLECLGLRTITISSDNIVWIGTDRGIEAMDISGRKIKLDLQFEWKYGIAESIVISNTILWVGTSYGLLKLKLVSNKLQLIKAEDFGLVNKIILNDNHSILVVTAKFGLIEPDEASWKIFNTEIRSGDLITCIKKTLDNFYLIGTLNGLYILNHKYEVVTTYSIDIENKKITAIAVVGDNWWIAFGHTLVLISPTVDGIKLIETINVGSIVKDLFIDTLSNIWIATNNAGLKKISCLRDTIKPIDCGINNSAFSIHEVMGKQKLIIGGDGFCSVISNGTTVKKSLPKVYSTLQSIVWDTCCDPVDKSVFWFATEDGLFKTIDEEPPIQFEDATYVINSPNRVLLTRENEIWLGTISGLFKIQNSIVSEIVNINGNKFGYVYTLACNANNQIIVGTLGQGLWIETLQGFKPIISEFLTENGNTYSVVPAENGTIAVIQEEKVILLDSKLNSSLILKEYPIAGWSSVWINDTTLATGSNNGILIIDTIKGEVIQRINLYLGKADWQFTSSRSLYIDAENKLFCGLNFGLYLVDYKKIQHFNISPQVFLDEITWHNVQPKKIKNGYSVMSGSWSVNIDVYAAWFIDEKQICFRFRLIGFDENWSDLSTEPHIRYNSLLPGEYELKCQAFTPLTGYGEIVTIMRLDVTNYGLTKGVEHLIDKVQNIFDNNFNASRKNKLLLESKKELEEEINDRKRAELELNRYKEQLEEIVQNRTRELNEQKEKAEFADKMKSVYLANMSHEIRTPLSIVAGLNKFLQQTTLDLQQSEYVNKIEKSTSHLQQIINDVLDISKIESGSIEIEHIPFSFNDIIDYINDYSHVLLKEKNIDFVIENELTTPYLLIGDPLRLKQVLINLISNAFKFTETGSVRLTIKHLNILPDKTAIRIAVSDTGIGIKENQIGNLFMAYKQADTSITRKYGGTGLGLSISYKFIELMGGTLKVRSVYNEGATFYFTLPFGISEELDQKSKENTKSAGLPTVDDKYPDGFDSVRNAKILIAEDDAMIQFIFQKILESEGFNFVITSNGRECVETLNDDKNFDIVFIDLHMPEMDGLETINFIRNEMKNNEIKIIALSANLITEVDDDVLKSGINDFLSKPIHQKNIFEILVKWLAK